MSDGRIAIQRQCVLEFGNTLGHAFGVDMDDPQNCSMIRTRKACVSAKCAAVFPKRSCAINNLKRDGASRFKAIALSSDGGCR
jgi:hypothetical protein